MPLERVDLARGRSGAAGASSSSSSAEKFTATPDELRTIEEKMKDPVFVSLMHDYMKSLEDPETRREEEAYLAQAEREAREGGDFSFEFVFPRAAYVVELLEPSNARLTTAEAKQIGWDLARATNPARQPLRSFLNVCHSDKVKAFTEHTTGDVRGSNWEVPVSVSQRRVEAYNPVASAPSANIPPDYAASSAAPPCILHDVVFHPSTLALAERSSKFMCFLTEIAVEHINGGYGESNGFRFTRLPGSIVSIGTPQNQTLRTQKGATPFTVDPQDEVLQRPTRNPPSAVTAEKPPPTSTSTKVKATAPASTSAPPPAAALPTREAPATQLPPHTITHRGSIDLTDAWRWSVSDRRVGVPEELVVRLTFAEVRRAAALDITVVPDGHALRIDRTEGQPHYEGLLVLPFSVEEEPLQAQFDRTRGVLTLTLKVVPPPLPDGVPTAAELRRTLPGGVGAGGEAEPADAGAESRNAAEVNEERVSAAESDAAAPLAEKGQTTGAVDAAAAADAAANPSSLTVTAPAHDTDITTPEVAHIGNQDRVAAMMAQVEAARAARIAAAAAAEEAEKKKEEVAHDDPAANAASSPFKTLTGEQAASALSTAAGAAEEEKQREEGGEAEAIPFIKKAPPHAAAPTPLAGEVDDAEAVRVRQQAWAAMMEAEMEVARSREEAEAAEAARAAEVQAAKARRRLAAEQERERLEQLAQAKRDAMPLSNKYIFSID